MKARKLPALCFGLSVLVGAQCSVPVLKQKPQTELEKAERAVREAPKSALAHRNLGLALLRKGQEARAESSFENALSLDRNDPVSAYNLGLLLAKRGQYQLAALQFRTALVRNPQDVDALQNLGVMLFQEEYYREALALFEKALRIRPNRADLHYNRGIALVRLGQTEEAFAALRRALALFEGHPKAPLALAILWAPRSVAKSLNYLKKACTNKNELSCKKWKEVQKWVR